MTNDTRLEVEEDAYQVFFPHHTLIPFYEICIAQTRNNFVNYPVFPSNSGP
jgi:hypothetical protein